MIRIAKETDLEFLLEHDRHISPYRLKHKINDGRIYICLKDNSPIGWLRYGFFWDIIPIMNMLSVLETYRGQGIGTRLVSQWESDMFQSGADMVLTSTQADEEAQHFYRKLGYQDCGVLFLPTQISAEIFLRKTK